MVQRGRLSRILWTLLRLAYLWIWSYLFHLTALVWFPPPVGLATCKRRSEVACCLRHRQPLRQHHCPVTGERRTGDCSGRTGAEPSYPCSLYSPANHTYTHTSDACKWIGDVTAGCVLDLQSRGPGFDSRSGCYQGVITWMGDCTADKCTLD